MIRITFQRSKCIGCYYCNEVAPYRWTIDEDDGRSSLIESEEKNEIYSLVISDDEFEDNLEASNQCPVGIIQVKKI